jgi:hypothetical protein
MTAKHLILTLAILLSFMSSQRTTNAQSGASPTPSPSLEQRVNDLEKRLTDLESIPAVALALKLKAQSNQSTQASPTPTKQGNAPLELESWSYEFRQGQYDYQSRHIFTYSLRNRTEKSIKLVDGTIVFKDRLGEKIMGIKLLEDVLYPSRESHPVTGNWAVNTFESSEQRLQTISHDDVQPELYINKVVFDDNSIWNADAH